MSGRSRSGSLKGRRRGSRSASGGGGKPGHAAYEVIQDQIEQVNAKNNKGVANDEEVLIDWDNNSDANDENNELSHLRNRPRRRGSRSSLSRRRSSRSQSRSGRFEIDPKDSAGMNTNDRLNSERKRWRDSRRFVFLMGALIGLLIPLYFGASHLQNNNKELVDKYFTLDKYVSFDNVWSSLDEWSNSLPTTGLTSFISDVQGLINPSESIQKNRKYSFAVGKELIQEMDIEAKHPVVMVPGVISTGIESWGVTGDEECDSTPHFRKRLWGSFYMLRTMVLDKVCWLKHVKLDPITGLDPKGFRLRAAQGFESSDFFVAGYWIWNKVIENLGVIGYDPNKMVTAAYDWRLAYLDLEKRDRYFSKLKQQIEEFNIISGEKAVLVGHSMGAQIIFYFLQWVEAEGEHYGNGGPQWVDTHVASFVNIAGTLLGAPKAVPALISGEMKDTVQLNSFAMYGLEKFFSRKERVDMLQTWGGIPSMLPKGGDLIWGNMSFSPEDTIHNNTDTYGNFIRFEKLTQHDKYRHNMTMKDSIDLVYDLSPEWLQERIKNQYTYGISKTESELMANKKHHSHWTNPLEVPLPKAPNMKMYCIYGVNNPTERAYVYHESSTKNTTALHLTIDYDSETPVFFSDGDGTVPIISHSMCHKWAQGQSPYNPANINVTIVEIKHEPERFDMRGGGSSAEHVDILGSGELNEYILKIVSGHGDMIQPRQLTNLTEWVGELEFPM